MSAEGRREQFNISALKFTDEVHDFIAELSRTRRLSEWIAKHAEEDLKRTGALTGEETASESIVLKELQSIKELLLQGGCQFRSTPVTTEETPTIQKISSELLLNTIEEDLEYQF